MPRHESYSCDACGTDITERSKRWGVTVTVGYSQGGWGHRRNHVDWSGEVCRGCYHLLGEKTSRFFKSMMEACSEMPYEIEMETDLPRARVWHEKLGWVKTMRSLFGGK